MDSPELQIAALSSKGLSIISGPPEVGQVLEQGGQGNIFQYYKDGSRSVRCNGKSIQIFQSDGEVTECTADSPVAHVSFSPQGSYLVTHERAIEPKGASHKNLKVWSCSSGDLVASFHKKGVTEDLWPAIQFDAAETHLFFAVKDAVVVYNMDGDFSKALRKVKMEGVTQFVMGPGKRPVLATFVPETGSKPAVCAVVEWSDGGSSQNRKQFFRASRCDLKWNSNGSHVLCQSICDFDATNQSYFGESRLYLLSADGRLDMAITMEGESSIVDTAWSPDGQLFVALGGHQPAVGMVFDVKGKPVFKLPNGPYNEIRWNPHGRFLLLAGFGNLPGDIRLFDRKSDNACKPMGACRSECSVLVEWSPCGRYFMTASVAPRMRVDNRITVYTYYGQEIGTVPYDELRAAHWKPMPADLFEDRGQSPERLKAIANGKKQGVNITAPEKKAGYVPPHMRGADGSKVARQVEGFDPDEAAGRIRQIAADRAKNRVVEGAEPTKAQTRNAKKRANKAKNSKGQGDKTEDAQLADEMARTNCNGGANGSASAPGEVADADGGTVDPAKRLRNLRKKLAKVETAKGKQSKGEAITPEQAESIASEGALRDEMRSLGATDV